MSLSVATKKRKTKEPTKPKRKVVIAINQSWSKKKGEVRGSSGPTSCFLRLQKRRHIVQCHQDRCCQWVKLEVYKVGKQTFVVAEISIYESYSGWLRLPGH